MLNKMRFATNTVAALAVTAILACLLLPRLGSTYGAAGTDKRQPSEMEPLAFSPGHWMNYLSQAWGGHTQAAGIPSEFRYVLLGLLSGNTSGTSYQFPSSTGPRNFSVQGWFYMGLGSKKNEFLKSFQFIRIFLTVFEWVYGKIFACSVQCN